MTEDPRKPLRTADGAAAARKRRQAEALRANLRRRKATSHQAEGNTTVPPKTRDGTDNAT